MAAPVARVEVVRETHFGVTVDDPYRWMKEPSAEYDSWLAGQGAYARQFLDGLGHRKVLLDRISELRRREPGLHTLAVAGGGAFALREDPQAGVPVLVARQPPEQAERVLFDPNEIAGAEHSSIDWYVPSPDGRHVACAISAGGAGLGVLRVIEVGSGTLLGDAIGNVAFPFLAWSDDGLSFVYHRYLDPPPGAAPGRVAWTAGPACTGWAPTRPATGWCSAAD